MKRPMWTVRRRLVVAIGLVAATALLAACAPPPTDPADQLARMIAFVEANRGHDFVEPPIVQFVDPAEFEGDVLANLAAEEAAIAPDATAFTALDWIDSSQDLITEYRKAYGGGVVGYYDPADGTLKVRGTDLTAYRREVIVHELTHALDDQSHDLSGLSSDGLLDADYLSKLVAIEGSAERVRSAYAGTFNLFEVIESLAEQLGAADDPELLTIPITLLTLTSVPYLRGAGFQLETIAALGNPAGPDQSLTRYPANTEQAFDTAKYLADEPAVDVVAPPTDSGAPVVRSGQFGPLLLSLVLREGIVLDTLDPLTEGWAGGSYTSWESTSGSCIRADTVWDTAADAAAVVGALEEWAGRHEGATVDLAATSVRLTRCD
ncbi:MAG: hypothetical protein ACK5O2_00030 [Microthrixaceae bacterium]